MTEESSDYTCASKMSPTNNTGPSGLAASPNLGETFCGEKYSEYSTTVLPYVRRGEATCPKCREEMEDIEDLPL